MSRERGIEQHRRDVTSALYWLVWHQGMSLDKAEAMLENSRAIIKPLARVGRIEGDKCFKALYDLAARESKRQRRMLGQPKEKT